MNALKNCPLLIKSRLVWRAGRGNGRGRGDGGGREGGQKLVTVTVLVTVKTLVTITLVTVTTLVNQLAIYKRGREFELGTTEHKSSKWPERDSNPGPPDCESDALTTRPLCLP